jgi:hypothetical protein
MRFLHFTPCIRLRWEFDECIAERHSGLWLLLVCMHVYCENSSNLAGKQADAPNPCVCSVPDEHTVTVSVHQAFCIRCEAAANHTRAAGLHVWPKSFYHFLLPFAVCEPHV